MLIQRIFIAINLPEEAKDHLERLQNGLGIQFQDKIVKWVNRDNMHLTLAFMGGILEKDLPKVLEICSQIIPQFEQFDLQLTQTEYGPPKHFPPKLVWIKAESDSLMELQKQLQGALNKNGFKLEDREFTPHLTLGRINTMEFRNIDPETKPDVDVHAELDFIVQSVEVMRSELKKAGAEYEVIESYPLKQL